MKEKQIAVLGGGSWGTTIAALMTRNAQVNLWARSDETVNEINTKNGMTKCAQDSLITILENDGFIEEKA